MGDEAIQLWDDFFLSKRVALASPEVFGAYPDRCGSCGEAGNLFAPCGRSLEEARSSGWLCQGCFGTAVSVLGLTPDPTSGKTFTAHFPVAMNFAVSLPAHASRDVRLWDAMFLSGLRWEVRCYCSEINDKGEARLLGAFLPGSVIDFGDRREPNDNDDVPRDVVILAVNEHRAESMEKGSS